MLRVGGLPDLAHAALAEEGGHVIVPEASTGRQGHDRSVGDAYRAILRPGGHRFHSLVENCPEQAHAGACAEALSYLRAQRAVGEAV